MLIAKPQTGADMPINNLREILSQLSRELQRAEDVDIDARDEMRELNRRVDLLADGDQSEADWLKARVRELETQFAAEHPTIARVARELADALAKMGI